MNKNNLPANLSVLNSILQSASFNTTCRPIIVGLSLHITDTPMKLTHIRKVIKIVGSSLKVLHKFQPVIPVI